MNQTSLLRGMGAGIVLLFASCASDFDTTTVPMSQSSPSGTSSQVDQLHASINQYRRSIGKAPLRRHSGLDRLAQQHCEFMAKNRGKFTLGSQNISHYGFEERALYAQRAFSMQNVAENVAGGKISGNVSATLVKSWVDSSKHIFNIKGNWDFTGVGIYKAPDGMVYATQFFATQNRSHMALQDRMSPF